MAEPRTRMFEASFDETTSKGPTPPEYTLALSENELTPMETDDDKEAVERRVEQHLAVQQLVGQQIGPYRVIRQIASGGMAVAVEAEHELAPGFRVCVKQMHKHLLFTENKFEHLTRFRREGTLWAGIRHPNVVRLYEYGENVEGIPYLALEYVEGSSVGGLLSARRQALPISWALLIMEDAAHALAYIHGAGRLLGIDAMVHRDVTPGNILLSVEGEAKLADFGIAKAMGGGAAEATATNMAMGTLAYMSPEQARCTALSGRSDLYSLGVVAYAMLTGRKPFQKNELSAAMLEEREAKAYPRIRELRPEVPEAVERIVDRLLEPDPAFRPADAHELLQMLRGVRPPFTERFALAQAVKAVVEGRRSAEAYLERSRAYSHESVTEETTSFTWQDWRVLSLAGVAASLTIAVLALMLMGRGSSEERLGGRELVAGLEAAADAESAATGPAAGEDVAVRGTTLDGEPARDEAKEEDPAPAMDFTAEVLLEEGGEPAEAPAQEISPALGQEENAPRKAASSTGRVKVTVIPFGSVWVNGKHVGSAPRMERLKPGRYTIGAGRRDAPEKTQTVTVVAGQETAVRFSLL